MEEDTEYLKLPIEDRCVHKAWKARLNGYEEAKKLFNQIDDEKSPEWNKFLGLLKKMVVDSNAVAQEKGLEAVLAYVENSAAAGKTVGDVMSGLVTKCIGAPKAKTKELAAQIALMYVEIEKHETVLEELLKGTEQKNPKIVSGCINIITQGLREFGIKVMSIKPILKRIPTLIEDRDKTVREETKVLIVEIYRWIGVALNPQLTFLKPVQMTELEAEFEKVKGDKAVPTRYLRSQQAKQAKIAAETAEADDGGEADECDDGGAGDVDPYELMVAVDILQRLPKDFYDKTEAKKWQERKEALDALDQLLTGGPKLESGDYGDLVRALKKMITKDSNVVIVALATKCLASIANGLKKRFQPYAVACISGLLEKFKEKKQNVVTALREAVDAIYVSTTLEAIQEDVLAALENKNPSVKAETAAFLARCFTKCTPVVLNKKLLKAFCCVLLKTLNESDPTVREASAEALGTAMKVVGEKGIAPFLADVDNLKMAKIKEACDKAELQVKQPKVVAKKPAPAAAAAKPSAGSTAPKPVKRPAGSASKKPAAAGAKKAAASGGAQSAKSKQVAEREMTPEEVDEKAEGIFPPDLLSGLADTNWKSRMAAVEQFNQMLATLDPAEAPSQLLFRLINKKPGLKDTNFQVAKLRLDAVKTIAENYPVSITSLSCVVTDVAERLGDAKTAAAAGEALTALAEATRLEHVAAQLLDYAFAQKNPKVQAEVFNWLATAIQEFGLGFQPKLIMDNVKKGATAINPAVRSAAISFIGVLSMYMGNQLMLYFDGEKPALTQQISAECEKHAGESPPNPTRGAKKNEATETRRSSVDTVLSAGGAAEEEEEAEVAAPAPAKRVDLSPFLNDAFVAELADKNWKVRAEAVQKLQTMVTDSKAISSNLGEVPPVLAARLVDSNTKIAAAALALCQSLAIAMGPDCRQHLRTFLPNFLVGMGDTKTWIRAAAITCINTWGEQCGYREFFEGEMIADALKSGSPALRSELWGWLAEKLPNIKSVPREEMLACVPVLLANLEDRNADVRKNAADAVLGVMMHTGYGPLSTACDKLKPGSQGPVKAILDKARGNLPEKPVQKSKSSSNVPGEKGKANAKMGPGSTATFVKSKPKAGTGAAAKPVGRTKKEAEEDSSPLMQNNSLKNQRAIDEHKLKTLKWNFTTPREEFVELLRDQMLAAGFNKNLVANLFHIDFKYHLKAIDMLNEDMAANLPAQRANLDLILKWMTLRFFDTNPSVILKGLEYVNALFDSLNSEGYTMIDNEVASFLPYLIIKIGDPKDTVRNSVKMILLQMWHLSTVQKIFPYLMDGIRSKNARQRAECLEHMSVMIDQNGLFVCVPSASVALKEIAKQISDRDNSVRNAALNCIVTAHYHDERALKMVGQISDKEMSLLEERIKRASKNRPVANVKPLPQAPPVRAPPREPSPAPTYEEPEPEEEEPPAPLPTIQSPPIAVVHGFTAVLEKSPRLPRREVINEEEEEEEDEEVAVIFRNQGSPKLTGSLERRHILIHDSFEMMNLKQENESRAQHQNVCEEQSFDIEEHDTPRPISGPYGLDQAFLSDIDSQPVVLPQPKLIEFDLHFLKEPSTIINIGPKPDNNSSPSLLSRMPNSMTLEWHLTQIGNRDFDRALDALAHIETLLVSDQHKQLYQHEDLLVAQLVRQLEFLNQTNHPEVVNCYRRNLGLFVKFFSQHPELSRNVRESTIREALKILITLLTEKRLEILEPGTDMFVRVVNNVIIRVLDKSDHTAVICALIKNLYDTVNNPAYCAHYQELLMKCCWKVIKFIDSWADDLQYDLIFTDVHAFLRDYPSSWWKKQPSDLPLRTIKTIMHTIVKVNGPVIGEMVRNVRGVTPESELWTYVQKLLKHLKCTNEERKIEPSLMDGQLDNKESQGLSKGRRMSKNSHDLLSEIFRKIGTKDETNEGIRMLYEFKQQYPEADINPFLQKSSQFFQDYIERGLKSIEADRRLAGVDKDVGKMDPEDKDSGAYLQRLRAWQAKAGWGNAPPAATRPSATPTPLSPPRQDLDLEPLPVRHSQLDTSGDSTTADESEVEALRKRLEKVKSSIIR